MIFSKKTKNKSGKPTVHDEPRFKGSAGLRLFWLEIRIKNWWEKLFNIVIDG
jgi:hypothetical protein